MSLADADALNGVGKDRHRARWDVLDPGSAAPLFCAPDEEATDLMLRKPREGENILADYASIGFTLRRHPLALLRKRLDKRGVTTSTGLWNWPTTPGPGPRVSSPAASGPLPLPGSCFSPWRMKPVYQ